MLAFKDLQETNHIFGKKLTAIVVLLTDSVTVVSMSTEASKYLNGAAPLIVTAANCAVTFT